MSVASRAYLFMPFTMLCREAKLELDGQLSVLIDACVIVDVYCYTDYDSQQVDIVITEGASKY